MKILITGSNGQLGSELYDLSSAYSTINFVFSNRVDLPLHELDNISNYLDKLRPDVIINAAAYTAVDQAERESHVANTINHLAVWLMAEWCQMNGAKLLHLSTDYVFNEAGNEPLKEETEKSPINEYGKSKHLGEEAILTSKADAIIIRTAWVYSPYGKNFVKTMLKLMAEREEISVVDDQIGSPTYARDLACAILDIIHANNWVKGIYHFANEGSVSWCDFAKAIRDIKRLDCNVLGIPTTSYPTPARRPKYSVLDKSKIQLTFNVQVPEWRMSLLSCLNRL